MLLLYILSNNDFSLSINLKGFVYKSSSENSTILLLRLAHIDKNSC